MNIGEIAEIITGVATFTVAVVLVLQLRKQNQQLDIQNKDNKREDAFRGVEIHLNRMSSIYTNKDFRKIFLKRNLDRDSFNDEEYLAINYYFRSFFGSLNTNFKVDKENNPEGIRFMLTIVLENKIGRYWYKNDFGKMLLDPDLIKIADEICKEYE